MEFKYFIILKGDTKLKKKKKKVNLDYAGTIIH